MQALKHALYLAGGPGALARGIEVAASTPGMWLQRGNVPPAYRPLIEKSSGGRVSVEEFGSDVKWVRIKDRHWPHPAGRPLADFAA